MQNMNQKWLFLPTLKELSEELSGRIVDVHYENKWIIAVLENGIRIKFRDWSKP